MGEGPEHNPFAPPAELADFELPRVVHEEWHLASYGQRFLGSFIDNLLYLPALIPAFLLGGLDKLEEPGDDIPPVMLAVVAGPLLLAIYQWYKTATTGQTLAKRWLGTRIVMDGLGTPPGFVNGVLLRNWLFVAGGFVPCLGYVVGIADAVSIFSGDRRQTLHDRVARTIVIRE